MNNQNGVPRRRSFCYRCVNGCIHVVCGNTTLTLKDSDFLNLADAMNELRLELSHNAQVDNVSETCAESLLM